MRFGLIILSLCLVPGLADAAQRKRLPDFFGQSFDAVSAQPLADYPLGGPRATPVKVDETGAIGSDGVPMPPPRPGATASTGPRLSARQASREGERRVVATAQGQPASRSAPLPAPAEKGAAQTVRLATAQPATPAVAAPAPGAPFALKVPANVRIRSGTSFAFDSRDYQLASLEGLGVNERCTPEKGGRCIRHPMRSLREAIAGRTLQCRAAVDGPATKLTCTR